MRGPEIRLGGTSGSTPAGDLGLNAGPGEKFFLFKFGNIILNFS